MEYIDRPAAKEIVRRALNEVADFSADFEDFTFAQFHPFHKKVFLNALKDRVNKTPCSDHTGNITEEEFFDIDLSVNLLNNWGTLRDCVDYITDFHYRSISPTKRIQFP